jgi:hypothetical protein
MVCCIIRHPLKDQKQVAMLRYIALDCSVSRHDGKHHVSTIGTKPVWLGALHGGPYYCQGDVAIRHPTSHKVYYKPGFSVPQLPPFPSMLPGAEDKDKSDDIQPGKAFWKDEM